MVVGQAETDLKSQHIEGGRWWGTVDAVPLLPQNWAKPLAAL
jgi:hypothetical protein